MPRLPNRPKCPPASRDSMSTLELLAPAGDWEAMEAALRAGADAVYFGLSTLNARRRAKNFTQEEFARAVAAIHQRGARAYLTLNIDLSERELGQAARIIELARQCGADAVLVRDPAMLAIGAGRLARRTTGRGRLAALAGKMPAIQAGRRPRSDARTPLQHADLHDQQRRRGGGRRTRRDCAWCWPAK